MPERIAEGVQLPDAAVAPLFEPLRLNDTFTLPNRIVMAPMTRCKAIEGLVPTPDAVAYYARRAACGLITTEGTIIRPDGQGYPDTPGLFTDAQVAGWRPITAAVHDAGGRIFAQIWHVGRVSHPVYLGGEAPIAPSAVALSGPIKRLPGHEYGTPRALETDEIQPLADDFGQAAANARAAGFDGVEIHGANGYIIDQFLHHDSNRRTDDYGGTPENMARFPLAVVDAVTAAIGADRTGLRLSPGAYHYMPGNDADADVFRHLLARLDDRGIAYVHTGIFDDSQTFDYLGGTATAFLRRHYRGTVIACGSYTPTSGAAALSAGRCDLVAYGRPLIANPDFVAQVRRGAPLREYDEGMLATLE
jgi:N-ethylmaleimide reductase